MINDNPDGRTASGCAFGFGEIGRTEAVGISTSDNDIVRVSESLLIYSPVPHQTFSSSFPPHLHSVTASKESTSSKVSEVADKLEDATGRSYRWHGQNAMFETEYPAYPKHASGPSHPTVVLVSS